MEQNPKILIVEDNIEMSALVSKAFKKEGFRVANASDGRSMKKIIENERVDLIILDIMLPGVDGLTLCRDLQASSSIPVIIVSAKGDELDRVLGLKMGADDYIAKPFSMLELIARAQAVLRRSRSDSPQLDQEGISTYIFAGWVLEISQRELVSPKDIVVPLSTGEFSLLLVLLQRPKRVLTRDQLLDLARGREAQAFDRSIDTQISRLRRKIEEDPRDPKIVKTVWGGGYILSVDVSTS